jgi:glycosyltransferase involved in cell wall biosynthesis
MRQAPGLSIIVPAYNAAPFVDACLGAILAQLRPDHELIVIDDGSTDATPAILARWQAGHGDDNFRVLRQANGGISAARNAGLAAAAGEYIAFIDSDDVLRPGSLALLDQAIDTSHADAYAFDFVMWHPERPAKSRTVRLGYPADAVLTDREAILSTYFVDRHTYVWAYVIRRAIYQQMPGPVFPLRRAFEDVSMLARLLHHCASLVHLPHELIDYRQHGASITKAVSAKWCSDFTAALQQAAAYFREQAVGQALQLHIDVAAAYFYMGVVKNSYQLPWREGRAARAAIESIFLASLFHPPAAVLAALRDGSVGSHDRKRDREIAGQLAQTLGGSLPFTLAQSARGQLRRWRGARG